MLDYTPKLTQEEIDSASMRTQVSTNTRYELGNLPVSKAKKITQTETYKNRYVTHTKHPLSFREARFIDAYMVCGDPEKAVGHALLKKDYIADEIGYRNELYANALIADRNEVMQYFTAVMRGEVKDQFNLDAPLTERTRAAEALAKRLIDDPAKAKQNIAAQQVVVNIDFNRDEETTPVVDVQQLSD